MGMIQKPARAFPISISPRRIRKTLLFIVLGFTFISLLGQFSKYYLIDYPLKDSSINLFDVNNENSLPTLYSILGLQICSILLAIIAHTTQKLPKGKFVRNWFALSLIFLFLSFDEALSIHERLNDPIKELLKVNGFFNFAWVIPGAAFTITTFFFFVNFLMHLPREVRFLFLLSGIVFVSGTIGMELLGGYWTDLNGSENFIYSCLTTIEEFLEMLGIVIFIYALLTHLKSLVESFDLSFKP